jgi:predicted nuclease of predicted toxin-antitoxin system
LPSTPHSPPAFFLDRSLGRLKLAAALRQAGASVEVHDDQFPQDAPDEVWLKAAGENGWVVLTKDKNIRFHIREKETLIAYGVRAFVLTAKALNAEEMAATFVGALPKIAKVLETNAGPFVATITAAGSIRIAWPTAAQ